MGTEELRDRTGIRLAGILGCPSLLNRHHLPARGSATHAPPVVQRRLHQQAPDMSHVAVSYAARSPAETAYPVESALPTK